MISKEEIIHCDKWKKLCDYNYERGQEDLPGGIIHCDIQSIKEFFNQIEDSKQQYIVISSRSDYGLCYQNQFPVWNDLYKAVRIFLRPEHEYKDLMFGARLNKERCNIDDLYSIRCYCHTDSTIDKIPENVVHWFVCNNCVHDNDRISSLPFGLNGVGGAEESINTILNIHDNTNVYNNNRDKYLYSNFQFYTPERIDIYSHYKNYDNDKYTCERDVNYETFTSRLLEHNFCLCPNGNGIDCYRTMECLYLGCIPIIESHPGTYFWNNTGLPIISIDKLYNLWPCILDCFANMLNNKEISLEALNFSYWKNKVMEKRELVLNST